MIRVGEHVSDPVRTKFYCLDNRAACNRNCYLQSVSSMNTDEEDRQPRYDTKADKRGSKMVMAHELI